MLHSLKQPADSQKLQTHSRLTPASILAKTNGREVKDQVVNAPMNDWRCKQSCWKKLKLWLRNGVQIRSWDAVPELKNGIVTLAEASLMKSCVGLSCGKAIVREDIEDWWFSRGNFRCECVQSEDVIFAGITSLKRKYVGSKHTMFYTSWLVSTPAGDWLIVLRCKAWLPRFSLYNHLHGWLQTNMKHV